MILNKENFGVSESYFNRAIECSKYFELKHDLDLARSLQGLSEVHLIKRQYKFSKTLISEAAIIAARASPQGKQSIQYCELKIREAKIESQFDSYQSADKIFQECLSIVKKKESFQKISSTKLKAQILLEKGRNFMKRASDQTSKVQRDEYLSSGEFCLVESMKTYESIDEDNHLKLADVIKVLGQIQFKREKYAEAQKDFEKSLELIKHYERHLNNSNDMKQKGDLFGLIGLCETFLKKHQNAIKDYDQSIKCYKKIYGSDHNRYSALAIGNLGNVYKNMNESTKAKDCFKCALSILGDISGKTDPDYLYFEKVSQRIEEDSPKKQFNPSKESSNFNGNIKQSHRIQHDALEERQIEQNIRLSNNHQENHDALEEKAFRPNTQSKNQENIGQIKSVDTNQNHFIHQEKLKKKENKDVNASAKINYEDFKAEIPKSNENSLVEELQF